MIRSFRLCTSLLLIAAGTIGIGWNPPASAEPAALDSRAMELPAAAKSMSPKLTAGADDSLFLSWLEPQESGHRLRYSVLQGSAWSAADTVAMGDNWFVNWADFPSVVPVSETFRAAHWLVRQPAGGYAYDVLVSLSRDGGRTWSEPIMPHDDGTPTEHGFVTLFSRAGGVGLVWLDGRRMAAEESAEDGKADRPMRGMTLRTATVAADHSVGQEEEVDSLVCDCCQTDVALTASGPVVVYRNRTEVETRDIYIARYSDGAWQAGQPVADDGWTIGGCPVNGPAVEARGNDVAVAWFTSADDQARVRVARSQDGGTSFLPPLDVNEGETFGRAGIAMLGHGELAVSWLCKRAGGGAGMCLRHVTAEGRMGHVHIISGDDDVPVLSVPQLALSGDFLHAVWTVGKMSGGGIRASRIAADSLR